LGSVSRRAQSMGKRGTASIVIVFISATAISLLAGAVS
jgi:hypothetical protein